MHLHFLIPGELATRTGGYEYDRRMIDGLRRVGWPVDVHRLDASFPFPSDAARGHADRVLAGLPAGALVVVDGLALGALPHEAARHAPRVRLLALVHHPLALETGLTPAAAAELHASEQQALASVAHVVVTSSRTAAALADFAVPRERISVIEPGTDPAPLARGSQGTRLEMVCVASLSPRKGHQVLFRALAQLRDREWHLTCVGSLEREPEAVRAVREALSTLQLEECVTLAGEADGSEIAGYYDRSDLFVLPTLYEGYGMVVAEALARGLPVISTPTGAIAELVTAEAGILVEAGDVEGWRTAVTRMLDGEIRAGYRRGAAARRTSLVSWDDQARRLAEVLTQHG